ncbi:U3 small nucleolar RNA-associated protein 10 [Naematelia encephala]|uniref:U3 small nucleolar RNA-associated protein 10 n=1 Tax=Naematelia encephala TaxID=71784 RepID=A0A1Y2BIN6_9TREE|nr:U3 small nucleolar RNA-associated protein 10 [Naematelia encephala]
MASSLASQLQNVASLDSSRLTSRYGAPSSKSYLFPPKEASVHDLDAIFALGQSGFSELVALDPLMTEFEEDLFSESAKRNDRMMLNKEENAALDSVIDRCLRRLGKWIGIMAGGKCIEWLVRRFRIHEMNSEILLQVFLPYHESPNFPRMLAILTLPQSSPYFAPFSPLIKNAQPLPRSYITTALIRDRSLRLLSDITFSLQLALDSNTVHRPLLAFWSSIMVELLEKARSDKAGINENIVKTLVEAFVGIMSTPGAGTDVNAAVYPPLVLLSRTVQLADAPFAALLGALITPKTGAHPSQRILTTLIILEGRPGWNGGWANEEAAIALATVPDLGRVLVAAMGKYDFDSAVKVVLDAMLDKPEAHRSNLQVLVEYPKLPASHVRLIVTRLTTYLSGRPEQRKTKGLHALLRTLRERHPTIVDAVNLELSENGQVPIAIASTVTQGGAFVDVYSADASARVASVERIAAVLNADDHAEDVVSAQQALLVLLSDQSHAVVQAVYNNSDDFVKHVQVADLINALAPIFHAEKLDNTLLDLHLEFIADQLLPAHPEAGRQLFDKLLLPILLATQTRTAAIELNDKINAVLARIPALGSLPIPHKDRNPTSVDDIASYNAAVIGHLSAVILNSPEASQITDLLLSRLDTPSSSASHILAALILAHLVRNGQGDARAKLAVQILDKLRGSIMSGTMRDVDSQGEQALLKVIAKKGFSASASARSIVTLLAALASVSLPNEPVTWFADEAETLDSGSSPYRSFANRVYQYATSDLLHPHLAAVLLRSIFAQIGDDSLVFLASSWTTGPISLQTTALQHATAFVKAYAAVKSADLQMVIPSVLVALQSPDLQVRKSAVQLLQAIVSMSQQSGDTIYALDTFYGERSAQVQVLRHSDLLQYLEILSTASDELVQDPHRLTALHTAHLATHSTKGRKDTSFRRAVISAFLSHIGAWRSVSARTSLLASLSGIKDQAMLRGIIPSLTVLLDKSSPETSLVVRQRTGVRDTYLSLLAGSFTPQSASVLVDAESGVFSFCETLLAPPVEEDSALKTPIRDLLLHRMVHGVFDVLPQTEKVVYIAALAKSVADSPTVDGSAVKTALSKLVVEPSVLIDAIRLVSEPLETSQQRKKQKQDDTPHSQSVELAVASLTVLIESRDFKALTTDAQLVAALMSTLSTLLARRQAIKEGIDYLEQEVLGAILGLVERINDPTEIKKAHIGIEVIIKVIRASNNPRTSQRALLVASELARLIPESVLHSVMPIFTFMGASDFQRDDAYSFGVVEKTVSSIVPVMVHNLREKATTKEDLHRESLTFVSIFTDMAGRLPKHRTIPFFVHLVKSLGQADFLAPIAMLLVDRTTSKSGRNGLPASQVMELPLAVANAFEPEMRLQTALDCVTDVGKLVKDVNAEEKEAFLSLSVGENADYDRTVKQISALLVFTSALINRLAGKACSQPIVEDIVRRLIVLAGSTSQPALAGPNMVSLIESALSAAMQLLAADNLLVVVSQLLDSDDEEGKSMALSVLVDRLPKIKAEVRKKSATTITTIINKVADALMPSSSLVAVSLSALRSFATSNVSTEDNAIAASVPKVVELAGKLAHSGNQVACLSLIELDVRRLGSRIIPHIAAIVDTSLGFVKSPKTSATVSQQSFAILASLIETVPTFISNKQLVAILHSSLVHQAKQIEASASIVSIVAKKITTKTLFPVVMDLWKLVEKEGESPMEAFFNLLRLTLRNADRQAMPGLLKAVFAFFLDVFDLRHRLQKQGFDIIAINGIEESAIGSFLELVTKLNEATFKPLFIRLYDWAIVDLSEGKALDDGRLVERKIVLLHVLTGLLQKFKHLLSPYIGILIPHIEELLAAYAEGSISDEPLWTLIMSTLAKSFQVDDGAYWTDALHLKLIPLLIRQLGVFSSSEPLALSLASMAGSTTSEPVLKSLNSGLCLATRSDDVQVRLAALQCLEEVWTAQPEELLPFVPETVSEFLAELLDDENGQVEAAARKVLSSIEKVTGSLKEYLE